MPAHEISIGPARPVLREPQVTPASPQFPLVVDLDGTLINTDLLAESANTFLTRHPFGVWRLPGWLAQGKAFLKSRLAESSGVDAASLPYNEELLAFLRKEKSQGRRLVLATASHRLLAMKVSDHLGIFDEVLASDGTINLKGSAKRDALVRLYGERGYEYVGNDEADLPVWQSAAVAHVVSRSTALIDNVRRHGRLGQVLQGNRAGFLPELLRSARPHQWLKNLLVFIPLLAAHQYGNGASVTRALLAFVIFGLTASSVYLLNDLVDLRDDRHHARKRNRPLASGSLSLAAAWIAWPLLLVTAAVLTSPLGASLPAAFAQSLAAYLVLTAAYSLRLKQVPIVDVLTLAVLYTLRIVAGAAAISVPLSFWLLSFSMFIFLSLAFIKRYSELLAIQPAGGDGPGLRGRGYAPPDLPLVSSLGGSAGYTAVLVLALYIQDSHTGNLYASPELIWLACPLLLFWISRAWLLAHRGQMHDDPVVFALKDRVSIAVAAAFAAVFVLARVVS